MPEETALYVGEAGNCLSDGTPLIPGVTIARVPTAEAEGSELWQPIQGEPASPLPRNAAPGTLPPPPADAPPVVEAPAVVIPPAEAA